MPVRRHEPIYVPTRASKYATHHDYGIEDSINRADYLSSAVLQDTYEAAQSSRGKDHALLRNLNAAIVSTEQHVNPRVAAVSRRVRASTAPPTSRPLPGQQVQQQQYIQEGIQYRTPSASVLYAGRPSLPKPTVKPGARVVEGYTKPKNVLSWEYRVQSRLSPDDLIYEPARFIRMREQVKDIQEKMNRQRQLLDRYLDSDFKIEANPPKKENINKG
uniref:Uncharacterized protein n=1 Tax=Arion vulgaris TaxID=1028688 RepID=A0A0B7ADU4_9EUPU